MLLREWHYADPTGWLVSEKFDGIRAIWDGKTLRTREGNVVPCPAWFTDSLPPTPLDGELWTRRGDLNGMLSIFAKGEKGDWSLVTLVVFDVPDRTSPARKRLGDLLKVVLPFNANRCRHVVCDGSAHLEDILDEISYNGGEGVVLRHPEGRYVEGRSGDCRKLRI